MVRSRYACRVGSLRARTRTVLEYATGMQRLWHQAAGSTIHGPNVGRSLASALPLPMSLFARRVANRRFQGDLNRAHLDLHVHEQLRRPSIPSYPARCFTAACRCIRIYQLTLCGTCGGQEIHRQSMGRHSLTCSLHHTRVRPLRSPGRCVSATKYTKRSILASIYQMK